MPVTPLPTPFGAKEILRYTRIRQPSIIDVARRAAQSPTLRAQQAKKPAERLSWARDFLKSDAAVRDGAALRYGYFDHLTIPTVPDDRLPSRDVVRDPKSFPGAAATKDARYRADIENSLASLLAFKTVGDEVGAARAARLLAFVELFPQLPQAAAPRDYPKAVLSKVEVRKAVAVAPSDRTAAAAEAAAQAATEIGALMKDLDAFRSARDKNLTARRAKLDERYRAITTAPAAKSRARASGAKAAGRKSSRRAAAARAGVESLARLQRRREDLLALKEEYRAVTDGPELATMLAMPPAALAEMGAPVGLAALQRRLKTRLEAQGLEAETFEDAYRQIVGRADALGAPTMAVLVRGEPAPSSCYLESPQMDFGDTVRLLGHADLVRVDETFVKYTVGEISYVENILPGEVKKRKVKTTKYFEEVNETTTEKTTDSSTESSTTTKQDLASQVSSEISTRMNTEMSAQASGSGGGTIGVVDFQGAGSASANMGIGVDTSFSSQDSSSFSQEILSRAIEKTKASSIERRMTRTYSLFETLHSHEINNASDKARNGIYCFLDKHVCLTETVYGKRLFVMASLPLPARNLLCDREQRLKLGLGELGQRPTFDVTVDQIQPATYKQLVARYKASNVSPPPPPLQTISRTYKTDNTNANPEKQGMDMKKAAELLAPFFEQYKRYLVTDNVRLPDGYELWSATATINHGRNGISVPAHLPLKLAGATLGTGVTMAGGLVSGIVGPALLMPLGMWQFEYGISPLLHYNTDSSNVSLCLGTETWHSPYFFFEPELLMEEIMGAFAAMVDSSPGFLEDVEAAATTLMVKLGEKAGAVPADVAAAIQDTVNDLVQKIKDVLSGASILGSLRNGFRLPTFDDLAAKLVNAEKLATTMKDFFSPFKDFIDAIIRLLREGISKALGDLFAFMSRITDSSQTWSFRSIGRIRGELPVTINAVAINPGITVNLVAVLARTEEALDKWRLETFDALYQAYLQQLADYETRAMMANATERVARPPAILRREEAMAIKELVLHALNNLHGAPGNKYDIEKINFLENVLDWENMNFRLFNYGPAAREPEWDKRGVFAGVDDRRRNFLKAAWAQVLVPAQENSLLEGKLGLYFENGSLDFEGGFGIDELTALYQELVNDRARIAERPDPQPLGHEVLPTEFIVLATPDLEAELPANPDPCLPPHS